MKIPTSQQTRSLSQMVGRNLKRIRTDQGVTQHDLAQAIGVEVETVSRYENGRLAPPIEQIAKISDFLGVHPASMFASQREGERPTIAAIGDKIKRLSDQDAKTLYTIIAAYVDAHASK